MSIEVKIRANNVTFKCFNCLQLKNPKKEPPHVIAVITSVTPTPTGQVQINLGNALLCPSCWERTNKDGKFIPASDISQEQAFIDKSGIIPQKEKGIPNA